MNHEVDEQRNDPGERRVAAIASINFICVRFFVLGFIIQSLASPTPHFPNSLKQTFKQSPRLVMGGKEGWWVGTIAAGQI